MKLVPHNLKCVWLLAIVALIGIASPAAACGTMPYMGEVCLNAAPFCPVGYAEANGQLLQIVEQHALFSLLSTRYGGDGRVTFGLPKLSASALNVTPSATPVTVCIATVGSWPGRAK